jgi:hypothetical protein
VSKEQEGDVLSMSTKDYAKAKRDLLSANARQQIEARDQRATEAVQRKYQSNGGKGK